MSSLLRWARYIGVAVASIGTIAFMWKFKPAQRMLTALILCFPGMEDKGKEACAYSYSRKERKEG